MPLSRLPVFYWTPVVVVTLTTKLRIGFNAAEGSGPPNGRRASSKTARGSCGMLSSLQFHSSVSLCLLTTVTQVARREDDASRHLRGALAPVDVYFQGEVDFDDPVLGIPYSAFVFHVRRQ